MLPLVYLIEDFEQARAALAHWPHTEDRLEETFSWYRISSSAIYPYFCGDTLHFLRLMPLKETTITEQAAQSKLLEVLKNHRFPAMRLDKTVEGEDCVQMTWRGEAWLAQSLCRVPGQSLEDCAPTQALFTAMGAALARLHNITQAEKLTAPSWRDKALLCQSALKQDGDDALLAVLDAVCAALEALPATPQTYGMIHYDYELDNVFWDDVSGISVIDFGDAMLHFYAQDVVNALLSIVNDGHNDDAAQAQEWFLSGYRSCRPLDEQFETHRALFERYHAIIKYGRIRHAVQGSVGENEPDWMSGLHRHLCTIEAALRQELLKEG